MRKNVLVLALLMSIVVFVVTGCGGGGGGGGVLPPAQPLATGTFVKAPADGGIGTDAILDGTAPYARWQNLYTADTISASGKLTGIALNYSGLASAVTCTGFTIKVGHTNLTSLTNTFASNVATGQGGQVTVLSNATVVFPAAAMDTWQTISFATPFDYNGKDNLVVELERTHACTIPPLSSFKLRTSDRAPNNAFLFSYGSGSATGTPAAVSDNARLVFSGGDDLAVSGGTTASLAPFGQIDHIQTIYLASEMTGTGPITGLAFQTGATTTAGVCTYSLKMGHTTRSVVTTTYADNYGEAPVTIVSNGTFTIPANVPAGEFVWIPFPGSFTYNGRDNLIVDLDVPTITAVGNRMLSVATPTDRSLLATAGSTTGLLSSVALNTKFRFNGGTMDVNPIALSAGDGFPFFSPAGARQWLFLASELGTSGNIDGIACRNYGIAVTSEQTYTNYRIVMSGTTAASLVADRATNLPTPVTVLQGTFVKPAGLRQGDYFTIPLSRSFPYNGTDNMVIDISGAGPSDLFGCWVSQDLSYTGRRSYSSDPSATTMGLAAGLPVMRFSISK